MQENHAKRYVVNKHYGASKTASPTNEEDHEKNWYKMSDEQNEAAYFMDFMKSKKHTLSMVPAGVSSGLPNLQLQKMKEKQGYKYEPPYGYGGNLDSKGKALKLHSGIGPDSLKEYYADFVKQLSHPVSEKRVSKRAPYNGRPPSKIIDEDFKPDPNLNLKPIYAKKASPLGYIREKSRELGTDKSYLKTIPYKKDLNNKNPYET